MTSNITPVSHYKDIVTRFRLKHIHFGQSHLHILSHPFVWPLRYVDVEEKGLQIVSFPRNGNVGDDSNEKIGPDLPSLTLPIEATDGTDCADDTDAADTLDANVEFEFDCEDVDRVSDKCPVSPGTPGVVMVVEVCWVCWVCGWSGAEYVQWLCKNASFCHNKTHKMLLSGYQ